MKKSKLTLCDKVLVGDIQNLEFEDKDNMYQVLSYWLENKNEEKSVFVCFQNWRNVDYRSEQQSILVSHSIEDIEFYSINYCEEIEINDIDYSIFEFESYEAAFKYCIDLREGL